MDPVISVVVSTRNRAAFLGPSLASLAEQRCDAPFEVVVVDNGSTDDTAEVIARSVESDPRFRCVREERVGLSYGKNAGIGASRGKILIFTDDDVILGSDWIDSYLALFGKEHELVAGGPVVPVRHDLAEWPAWLPESALYDIGRLDYRTDRLLGTYEYVWGANMAAPATLFERLGGWNVDLGRRGDQRGTFEDAEFQDRARAAGVPVVFSRAPIVRHRVDAAQVTPRAVLATAFSRGRSTYWQAQLGADIHPGRLEISGRVGAAAALLRYGFAWLIWAATSRVRLRRRVFVRAHRAAWSAGWALEELRDGHESRLSDRALLRVMRIVRGLANRLAAGGPARATPPVAIPGERAATP